MQWLEDISVGAVVDLGTHHFEAAEIIAFARDFDPQPFHLSEEAGRASLFKGLAASGWHTTAVWRKLMTTYEAKARASAGVHQVPPRDQSSAEDLRWLKPTLAGDTLSYRVTLLDVAKADASGWGLVTFRAEGMNQRGELVFHLIGRTFARSRATD